MHKIMDKRRRKGANFTAAEVDLLMKCILKEIKVLENKKTDGATLKEKQDAWKRVELHFRSINTQSTRDLLSIKMKYDNIKRNLKKNIATIKNHCRGTGGGPPIDIKLSWYEEQLYAELCLSIDGLASVGDSDTTPIVDEENTKSIIPVQPSVKENGNILVCNEKVERNYCPENSSVKIIHVEEILICSTDIGNNEIPNSLETLLVTEVDEVEDVPETLEPPRSTSRRPLHSKNWNLHKRKRTATSEEKQSSLQAFQTLTSHKAHLTEIQQQVYEAELRLKNNEIDRAAEEWEIKRKILEVDLHLKQEQLNEAVAARKIREAAAAELHALALEEARLKIQVLQSDLCKCSKM